MSMYLKLFHGFKSEKAREKANDWGVEGPHFGPLEYAHTTYGTEIKCSFVREEDARKFRLTKEFSLDVNKNGCVVFRGMQYGDWSCYNKQGGVHV